MITTGLLTLLYWAIYAVLTPLRLLPDATLPAGVADAIGTASEHLSAVSIVLPTGSLLAVLGIFLSVEAALFLYKTLMWIVKKIPTIN